jgi:hypothetical protein
MSSSVTQKLSETIIWEVRITRRPQSNTRWCRWCRVPHGYGFTHGFQAKVLTVTVTVPDFDTCRQTVPIPAVSRYCTYTFMGL